MNNFLQDVAEFNSKFGIEQPSNPGPLPFDLALFRAQFTLEEGFETLNAILHSDLVKFVDGLVDTAYIACGNILAFGFHEINAGEGADPLATAAQAISEAGLHVFTSKLLDSALSLPVEELDIPMTSNISLCYVCIALCEASGIPFSKAWNIVHRANMRKEKATKESQTPRNYIYDVVKPADWVSPEAELKELIDKHNPNAPFTCSYH